MFGNDNAPWSALVAGVPRLWHLASIGILVNFLVISQSFADYEIISKEKSRIIVPIESSRIREVHKEESSFNYKEVIVGDSFIITYQYHELGFNQFSSPERYIERNTEWFEEMGIVIDKSEIVVVEENTKFAYHLYSDISRKCFVFSKFWGNAWAVGVQAAGNEVFLGLSCYAPIMPNADLVATMKDFLDGLGVRQE